MPLSRLLIALCALCALALVVATVPAHAENSEALLRGYDLAYNLDHDEAIATFSRIVEANPDDPAAHRSVAAAVWLRILFLRGGMLVDNYMVGSVSQPTTKVNKPPEELDELFRTHIERAVELSEQAVKDAWDDPDAHYNLGASVALAASYRASIEGSPLSALRDAKRAYEAHQKVLELDPSRKDANLMIGIYRYVVSLLPRAFRMMAYLVGFDGGKEEALAMIREAATYPSEAQTEAKFALVLLYNREREFAAAQRVLNELKRRYPDNRLVWLESAATHIRNDQPLRAEGALRYGFAKFEADTRTRMFGEEAVWRLKRGMARLALDRPADALPDLVAARDGEATAWVVGHAHVELGKIADIEGDRARAAEEYDLGRKLCGQAKDTRCENAAKAFKKYSYTAKYDAPLWPAIPLPADSR